MSSMSRPRTAVAAGLTLGATAASIFLAPSAFAATYLGELTVTPESVQEGGSVTISGADCLSTGPDDEVAAVVYADGDPTNPDQIPAIGETDPVTGAWTVEFAFGEGTVGKHSIDAYCGHYSTTTKQLTTEDYAPAWVTVTAAAPAAGAPAVGAPAPAAAAATTTAPLATTAPVAFKPGATPNTPGVASTTTDKTTGPAAAPGQKVVKVLKGFKAGEKVTVVLHSDPVVLGVFTADANGVVTVEFTVPAGTPLGNHTLAYDGDMGTHFEEALQLTADGKALAYTGASIAMPLIGGSVLLAAGAGAMVVGRRRRAAGAAQA